MNPIVIPQTEASNLNPSQLKEYIKNHPSVLEHGKKEKKSEEEGKSEKSEKNNIFIYFKEETKDDKDIKNDKDSDNESDEEYVSKKEIDIQKLEDIVRYLKLDLNNEQLKVEELNESLKKESKLRQHYAKLNKFTKEYIYFMQYKPFTFTNYTNYTTYNTELIQVTKMYHEMEATFRKLLRWKQELVTLEIELTKETDDKNDKNTDILDYFEREIRSKFDDLNKSYQNVNQRLTSFAQKMMMMKYIIIFLFLSNLFFMFR